MINLRHSATLSVIFTARQHHWCGKHANHRVINNTQGFRHNMYPAYTPLWILCPFKLCLSLKPLTCYPIRGPWLSKRPHIAYYPDKLSAASINKPFWNQSKICLSQTLRFPQCIWCLHSKVNFEKSWYEMDSDE